MEKPAEKPVETDIATEAYKGPGAVVTSLGYSVIEWKIGIAAGLASSRLLWRTLIGHSWPAEGIRRLLAIPRSIHELIWGLLLLQVIGLQPVIAVIAIAIPYGALVARVVSDLLDSLNERNLQALMAAGTAPPAALLSAMGPPLLPGLISYGGYRLECALRSATLLGVFGLGGLGNELLLTLQSLQFHELWSGLWLLLAVMLSLEAVIGALRRRWGMPGRFSLRAAGVGRRGRELALAGLLLVPLVFGVGRALAIEPAALLHWQALPPLAPGGWQEALALPWPSLVFNTVLLTLLAAALAVGVAPLLLLLVAQMGQHCYAEHFPFTNQHLAKL